ncbi:proline-rich protein 2-like [Sarcophilus harrisii]|uniref:proline-rich protein 2-like n=1 Tax=Sarcophilus harrisii TaxID=9305 RepID=UPI001301E79E|nr:proline-rich protein 2-like [Sarcophilus harrisii]
MYVLLSDFGLGLLAHPRTSGTRTRPPPCPLSRAQRRAFLRGAVLKPQPGLRQTRLPRGFPAAAAPPPRPPPGPPPPIPSGVSDAGGGAPAATPALAHSGGSDPARIPRRALQAARTQGRPIPSPGLGTRAPPAAGSPRGTLAMEARGGGGASPVRSPAPGAGSVRTWREAAGATREAPKPGLPGPGGGRDAEGRGNLGLSAPSCSLPQPSRRAPHSVPGPGPRPAPLIRSGPPADTARRAHSLPARPTLPKGRCEARDSLRLPSTCGPPLAVPGPRSPLAAPPPHPERSSPGQPPPPIQDPGEKGFLLLGPVHSQQSPPDASFVPGSPPPLPGGLGPWGVARVKEEGPLEPLAGRDLCPGPPLAAHLQMRRLRPS